MTQQKLMTLPNLANLPLKSTTIAYKEPTHSWLNSWTSTSKVNMPKHTERNILNFLEKFKRTHPHLDVAPPRPKNERDHKVRRNLHPVPELNEYVEYVETNPIKIEHVEYDKLKERFEKMNNTKLGAKYLFEVGKGLGLPFTGELELYSPENPVGQQYSGYMQNVNTGEMEEINLFIMPKN